MKKTEINGCTVLEADAGKKIVKDNEFVCGTVVWLAVGDATDAYKEVSVEEADAIEKTQRETEGVKPDKETPSAKMPTDIDMAKAAKIAEIAAYSDSDAVNSLTFNGLKTWLTPNVRANYLVSLDAAELLGETDITFVVEGVQASLPIKQVRLLLAKIQRYADACFLVTERHKIAVRALQTVEEVEKYDYTKGYPEKLAL
ncbi:DUF4376 domain-containing protein [Hoylesella timonensis]|uniref:DUF4376 domain-containing protein n=1 Tax=Hoylesella timonensis TaxID=386414 RepID=UPI0024302EDC|nr:DUF4376 domain-containing protein [Hoylesella timonensis]